MSHPRTKRPFAGAAADPAQRQITSFFAAADAAAPAARTPPRQPALPPSVQANLLGVGMRVRKSVPEGYKTPGHSVFKLWTDATVPGLASPSPPPARAPPASRELLPFCGINKIGGLATQHLPLQCDADDDGVPELTLTQESVDSTASDAPPSRKRILDDDDADDADDADADADARPRAAGPWAAPAMLLPPGNAKSWDDEISPRTLTAPMTWGNTRPVAVPRSRRPKGSKDLGQENLMVLDAADFDDVDFLVGDMDTSP